MNQEMNNIEFNQPYYVGVVKERNNKLKDKFPIFFIGTVLNALIFAFCVYQNVSGLASCVYVLSGIAYVILCLKLMELPVKRGSIFYIVAIVLLGINSFYTDNGDIILLNRMVMLGLKAVFLFDNIFDTNKWQFSKYISATVNTGFMSIGEVIAPLEDTFEYLKSRKDKDNSKIFYGLIGCVLAIPAMIVMLVLLSSADVVFEDLTLKIFGNIDIEDMVGIGFLFGAMFLLTYCIMSYLGNRELDDKVGDTKTIEPLIVIPVTLLLTIIYVIFSWIQIAYLFVGEFKLPYGYTYAMYAREGFFQLLAVSIINLVIVLASMGYTKRSKVLKVILTVMSACTFIMIASSAVRMITYIRFYYLTFLRVFVLWSLLVLFVIFIGVIIYIYKESFPIFKYTVVVITCLYIGLAFSRPDYFIAKVNLSSTDGKENEFFLGGSFDDYGFLLDMSADAAPVVADWMEEKGYKYNGESKHINKHYESNYSIEEFADFYMLMIDEDTRDMGIRNFNVSRYKAKLLIGD